MGKHTLGVSKSGRRRTEVKSFRESGLDGRNLEGKSAQIAPSTELEVSTCPDLLVPKESVVATVVREGCFFSQPEWWNGLAVGGRGKRKVGAPGSLPIEPSADSTMLGGGGA